MSVETTTPEESRRVLRRCSTCERLRSLDPEADDCPDCFYGASDGGSP